MAMAVPITQLLPDAGPGSIAAGGAIGRDRDPLLHFREAIGDRAHWPNDSFICCASFGPIPLSSCLK